MKRNGSHPSGWPPRRIQRRRPLATIIAEQKKRTRERRACARDIVRGRKLRTMAEAKKFAQDWIECAMGYAANADYHKAQCERAYRRGVADERRRHR